MAANIVSRRDLSFLSLALLDCDCHRAGECATAVPSFHGDVVRPAGFEQCLNVYGLDRILIGQSAIDIHLNRTEFQVGRSSGDNMGHWRLFSFSG